MNALSKIDERLQAQPRWLLLAEAVSVALGIGLLDYSKTAEVTLSACYAAPILLVGWYGGRESALSMALLCTLIWWAANEHGNHFHTPWGYFLATLNRLAYFAFFALGGTALKDWRAAERARLKAQQRTWELEREIVRVSEKEQRRIGQDLHDGLCQHLAAIGCAAKSLADDLSRRFLPEAADAQDIEGLINDAVVEARNLARGIFPVQIEGAGLAAALDELAATVSRLTPATVSVQNLGDVEIHDPEAAMHLYRIAQEALNNALKHGHATKVILALNQQDGLVMLTINDDGIGLERSPRNDSGMGFSTMRYRAQLLGARLEVRSSPLGGVRVSCLMPVASS